MASRPSRKPSVRGAANRRIAVGAEKLVGRHTYDGPLANRVVPRERALSSRRGARAFLLQPTVGALAAASNFGDNDLLVRVVNHIDDSELTNTDTVQIVH